MKTRIVRAARIDNAEGSEISYVDHPANSKSEITGILIAKRTAGLFAAGELLKQAAWPTPERHFGVPGVIAKRGER